MTVKIVIVAFIYFLSAKAVAPLSLVESESVFAIWPPTGIAFGALFLYGYRIWPGIFIGALLLNLTISPLALSIQIALTNTLGPIIGFWFLNKFNRENIFSSLRMIMLFLIAVIFASAITATGGVYALFLHGFLEEKVIFNVWSTWFLGDFIGFLLITPIIDALSSNVKLSKNTFTIEGILMALVLTFTLLFIFGPFATFDLITYPVVYFLLPPLIWATLRFEATVAVIALLGVTLFSIYGTILGYGPFIRDDLNQTLLLLQSFSTVLSITILTMSAIFHERDYIYKASN